jgi:Flp pilus assembly protein TadG
MRIFRQQIKRRTRSLFRCRKGSTAVEFSIVVMPFLGLMMSSFEIGWFYLANSVVDAATIDAARVIRTGEAQKNAMNKEAFFNAICPSVAPLGNCRSRMTVEVRTFATFAQLAADTSNATCADDQPTAVNAIPYQPGAVSEIVRVRICYLYDTMNPALGANLSQTANGRRRIVSAHIFRNEPF